MRLTVLLVLGAWCLPPVATAQVTELNIAAELTGYGDNTEFSNPFRVGETLVGTFGTLYVEAKIHPRLALRAGAFGHQRFGSERGFDEARPLLAIVIGGPQSQLVFGTLETMRRLDGPGPDRAGPHGLLPPIQRETLAFDRPWEAGLQWTLDTPRVHQDAWIHWQRFAAPGQRERFDAGVTTRVRVHPALRLRADLHHVHQGGQVSAVDPVSDSAAAAAGVEVAGRANGLDRLSLEAFALVSRHVPDRALPERSRTGFGTFLRLALEEGPWRLHGILWRGCDFIKAEGDPLYHSIRRDGTRYRGLRDYLEAGLTRTFPLAPGSTLEASARWHRVEHHYEYSFRLLAVVGLRQLLWRPA